jgi:drug/metabolite transporter (DMT)-like permease
MDTVTVKRKRRRLAIGLAILGLVIAVAFALYFETDPRPGSTAAVWSGMIALFLCPGSLLFVTAIDIEPQTSAFAVMWLIIGLINFALYGGIGLLIGQFRWKADGPSEASERPLAGG